MYNLSYFLQGWHVDLMGFVNIGLVIVVVVSLYLFIRSKDALKRVERELLDLKERNELQEKKLHEHELQYAILNSRYEESIKSSNEKLALLKNAKEELSREFQNLSNKIYEDKAKQFGNASKEQLEMFLKPFREQVALFAKQSQEQFVHESKERHLLKDELVRLKAMNEQLSQDALNLTNALKGENKTQGNWGEIILERILEQSGLREGVEYELQGSFKSEEGKLYRPDAIIHMPSQRDVIIDSKVSLRAYEQFMSSDDTGEKKRYLSEHLASIASHVKGLSAKQYEKLQGVNTLDFVLLFMPIEGAFLLALEHDGEFFKRAYESNILVVSPSTLLVTLRTIEHIWRNQRQQDHALKIAQEAEAMLDKLSLFVDEMHKIGAQIDKTKESYNTAMNRLSTGRGNVIKRAENIVELGIKTQKRLSLDSQSEL